MKIHVLGFWGTYPGPGEATTGFLVETDHKKILLDCGSGVLAQLQKICSVEELDAVIVTHHHHDHVADLGVLGYAMLLARLTGARQHKLPMYMPLSPSPTVDGLQNEPLIDVMFIDDTTVLDVDGWQVTFAPTVHPVPCFAVRFEKNGQSFVFSADTSWADSLVRHAEGADLFICEASMYAGQEENARNAGHLTSVQAGKLAKDAGVKRLALTHYPHYGDWKDLFLQAEDSFGNTVDKLDTLQVIHL
ncbi:MBL fold metallo-hydrolase [Alicyclobacillus sp. SO9]|uniref:MBL fold metallo-hydrolase n=1 Tax=Alicyclobacillus sp. SO9 TaxID=2665646 RepID=UPI0018E75572|nr:MBL fold metallo-hydrolase [Alicyclobacillus sp. SO9]QQE78063.1 MBL fold metallo-hydrolase [Alicyclobacillus sp. SO9]